MWSWKQHRRRKSNHGMTSVGTFTFASELIYTRLGWHALTTLKLQQSPGPYTYYFYFRIPLASKKSALTRTDRCSGTGARPMSFYSVPTWCRPISLTISPPRGRLKSCVECLVGVVRGFLSYMRHLQPCSAKQKSGRRASLLLHFTRFQMISVCALTRLLSNNG